MSDLQAVPIWLTVREAARLAGVDNDTIRRWADSGRVAHQRTPGGHRRIEQTSLQQALAPRSKITAAAHQDPLAAITSMIADCDQWWGWRPAKHLSDDDLATVIAQIERPGGLLNALQDLADTIRNELRDRDDRSNSG